MAKKCRVVPAILTDDPELFSLMFRQAESFTDYVQVDIMDGRFVPSRSIVAKDLVGLQASIFWEVHLMVDHPELVIADYQRAGAGRAVFHYESTDNPHEAIKQARKQGMTVGIALNPETPVKSVMPLLNDIDSILLLSVNPGYYGSPFIPKVLAKIPELRTARTDLQIGIDGGIKENNIAEIARTGVDYICVGSAVFMQPDPAASFRRLQLLATNAAASG